MAIWIRQGIIGIRIEWVYRVCLTTKLESDVNLSVAGYKPYWAETFHGLQRCTRDAGIYRARQFPLNDGRKDNPGKRKLIQRTEELGETKIPYRRPPSAASDSGYLEPWFEVGWVAHPVQ